MGRCLSDRLYDCAIMRLIVPMIFGGIVSLLTFASSAVIAILITGIAKAAKRPTGSISLHWRSA